MLVGGLKALPLCTMLHGVTYLSFAFFFLVVSLATTPGILQGFFEPSAAMSGRDSGLGAELSQAYRHLEAQRQATQHDVYNAGQDMWFDSRRAAKRGPPSTLASTVQSHATPPSDHVMETAQRDAVVEEGVRDPPTERRTPSSLFQPMPIETDIAYQMTAAQRGVDINDVGAMQAYMATPLPTRNEVLQTIRDYHLGVLRPEIFNLITQVENVIGKLDDKILKTQESLQWLASDNRQQQKKESAMLVVTSGWDKTLAPADRLFQINWMLEQLEHIKQFIHQRVYNASDSCRLWCLSALAVEPSTPPAGPHAWSTVTMLQFKDFSCRKAFVDAYGGGAGCPLYKDAKTPVKQHHIRVTAASPQFQRKLELPLRVALTVINRSSEVQGTTPEPIVILWRTLTVMKPAATKEFNPQARAWARMTYYEQSGELRGLLEVDAELFDLMSAKPPHGDEENLWAHCWNQLTFGVQHELDVAEKQVFTQAALGAKGSSKGISLGKSQRHWSAPFIYNSAMNPFPIPMTISKVDAVSYCWDEYCDKVAAPQHKVGNYQAGTFEGAPVVTPPAAGANLPQGPAPSEPGPGKGRGK